MTGNIQLEQAVRAQMQAHSSNRLDFLTENLDAGHFSDQAHFHLFQDHIEEKYAGQKLDLILAFTSRDYRLADELPEALFPDVPVVFVAVNEHEVPQDIGKLGVTGIVQRFNLRGTLGLILHLRQTPAAWWSSAGHRKLTARRWAGLKKPRRRWKESC